MMEIPIALFVVLLFLLAGGAGFFVIIMTMISDGDLVPRKRIQDHAMDCYTYSWKRRSQQADRISHLERELARVPKAMRSRKTRKLIG